MGKLIHDKTGSKKSRVHVYLRGDFVVSLPLATPLADALQVQALLVFSHEELVALLMKKSIGTKRSLIVLEASKEHLSHCFTIIYLHFLLTV